MRFILVAVALLAAGTALAQASPEATADYPPRFPSTTGFPSSAGRVATAGSNTQHLSAGDRSFLEDATAANLAQINLGALAISKGSTEQIRTLGHTLIDDHTDANGRLQGIATRLGVTLPIGPNPDQVADYERIASLSGSARSSIE